MSKHTPGPWAYSTSQEGWSYTVNIFQADNAAPTDGWSDVAYIVKTCAGEQQAIQEANARLIAAAPDLLEALQNLSIVMRELHDHWDNDRDMKVGKGLLALSGLLPGYDKRIDVIHAAIAKATRGNNV